jgi:diguanylate cyclase (GGDEF)-like protein
MNPLKSLYPLVTLFWLVLMLILSSIVIGSDIGTAKTNFNNKTTALYNTVHDLVKINETVVEGFAATISAAGSHDWKKIREYAKQMNARYSHIFMFEITEKVKHKNKEKFERYLQKNVYKNFKIRAFTYETNRQWQDTVKKEFYMPITFMEPFLPGSEKILGLDVSSNAFLMSSLQKAIETHAAISTMPFTLIEGDLAYLIYKPIIKYGINPSDHDHCHNLENSYAILVILTKSLFKNKLSVTPEYYINLFHSDFSSDDKAGTLFKQQGAEPSSLESLLLPKLSFYQNLDNQSQPFILNIEQQLGWKVLSFWLLSIIWMAGIVSFFVMLHYAKVYHQVSLLRLKETENLFYLANHDELTGLANRNLLLDRLKHALTQAKRSKTQLAILFMDLNKFKPINDVYGHAAGDQLLRDTSNRLLSCIRTGDTLSRRSGDEFILILENIKDQEKINTVVKKIKFAFEKPFSVGREQLNMSISIGTAIYPTDGKTEEELLQLADNRMYLDKESSKT